MIFGFDRDGRLRHIEDVEIPSLARMDSMEQRTMLRELERDIDLVVAARDELPRQDVARGGW